MPFKECVDNSWTIKIFACAGISRDLSGKFKSKFQNKYIKIWLRALKIGCQMTDLEKFPW